MAVKESLEQAGGLATLAHETAGLQLKNILCPLDFSPFSQRALRYAVTLARHFGAHLFLQHTVQLPVGASPAGIAVKPVETDSTLLLQSAREEVRRLLIAEAIDTSEVTVLLNEGDVSHRIAQALQQERIDLLVMGTHGHKGFNRLVLGSVTETVIHEAVCPVLAVNAPKSDFLHPQEGERLRTILLATDFSALSERALVYALRWSNEWAAKLVIFHAVEEQGQAMKGLVDLFPEYNPSFEEQIARAWEKARELVPAQSAPSSELVYEIRHGSPKEEVLRVAQEKGADLIVTGARGAGKSGAPWGSVSSAIVRDGRFPVLVVRELGG